MVSHPDFLAVVGDSADGLRVCQFRHARSGTNIMPILARKSPHLLRRAPSGHLPRPHLAPVGLDRIARAGHNRAVRSGGSRLENERMNSFTTESAAPAQPRAGAAT
jgi:hypothetical protein